MWVDVTGWTWLIVHYLREFPASEVASYVGIHQLDTMSIEHLSSLVMDEWMDGWIDYWVDESKNG